MRVTDEEARLYSNSPGASGRLAADLLESRAQVVALTLDLAEHKAALEQAQGVVDAARRFYESLDVDHLDPEYFSSGSDGHRYQGLRTALAALPKKED